MNVKVTKDNVSILNKDELKVHVGEYKVNLINFDFSEEYTKDLVLNALFVMNDGSSFQTSILDNECHIPGQVLESKGHVLLGVYAYKVNEDELELRYSPRPDYFNVELGSYNPDAEESQEITPTQFEQYMQALNDGLNQVKDSISELNQATDNANDLVDEINKKLENGEFIGPQGPQGETGPQGPIGKTPNVQVGTVETLEPTEQASVTRTGTDEEPLFNFGIPKGEKGDTGEVTEDTLDNVVPKQTATDSIINVNDALKYKIFDFKVDGAYKQTTSDGSNLLDIDYSTNPILGERGDIQASLNNDYSFTVTGNKTDAEWSNIYFDLLTDVKIKQGTQYYVHDISLVLLDSELQFVKNMSEDFIADADYIVKRGYYTSNKQGDINEVIHPYLGTVPYDESKYYKYTGGNPSPNPNYPQEITTLTFDMITRRGKNLSDYQETNYQIDLQGNELVALPNGVKDYLQIDKEGNVSLIKNIGKKIFDGTENNWWLDGTNQYKIKFEGTVIYNEMISDKFINSNELNVGCMLIYLNNYIRFISDKTSLEDWIAWLQENNVTVYYQLAEPQTISLGKLSDLITTEQGSNTFAINGNIDTNISTTYALDLKKYIDNKIATVSSAVIEQE